MRCISGVLRTASLHTLRASDRPRRCIGVRWRSGTAAKHAPGTHVYRQLTAVEHVLLRPGMYIGSVEARTEMAWVFEGGRMVWREVKYVPALLKLFDELLVNAMDNVQRDAGTTSIQVSIGGAVSVPGSKPDVDPGVISVYNSGRGIPVVKASAEAHGLSAAGLWLPQMVLGELYTGSNFDDGAGSMVGGRHGFGAKLANIFSEWFSIETADTDARLLYSQIWRSNMSEVEVPLVKPLPPETPDFTRVTMMPDYARLLDHSSLLSGNARLDADTLAMLTRRVYEAAACVSSDVTVALNGAPIDVNGLEGLMGLYPRTKAADAEGAVSVVRQLGPRWKVGVAPRPDGAFAHVSFVNGVATPRGGTHVELIERQLVRALMPKLSRAAGMRVGEDALPTSALRSHLMLFVDSKVEDPEFDSQTKERLTTPVERLGLPLPLPAQLVSEIATLPWLRAAIAEEKRLREARSLARAVGGSRAKVRRSSNISIEKLDDAEWAGVPGLASECTLIVTEGDSAKALAVAGLEVVGRERWGVFPLRGKVLNVRGAAPSRVTKNEEIVQLMRALGVEPTSEVKVDPTSGAPLGLRYGRLLLMTDQDEDGAHIKGLVISMLDHFWPSLTRGAFVQEFITPLLKVHRTSSAKGQPPRSFYSIAEYDEWHASLPPGEAAKWRTKYYKGLGTSTASEAREYFREMHRHRVQLTPADSTIAADLLDMAFSPTRTSDRKGWMSKAMASSEQRPEDGAVVRERRRDVVPYDTLVGAAVQTDSELQETIHSTGAKDAYQDLGMKELRKLARSLKLARLPRSKEALIESIKCASVDQVRRDTPECAAMTSTPASRSLESFVQGDLVQFSVAALRRSLPSLVDGLKPSQRKVLHACFKKKLVSPSEMKVAQLASYVADVTQYHHGESSLVQTIIKMAQDYLGSSNIPLLEPLGQFGTRALGGDDAASARYIFTRLSPMAPLLFPQADFSTLQYNTEDGVQVEPTHFVPLLPMILVNGSSGIGTGWSTNVYTYHPIEVLEAVLCFLKGEKVPPLMPWVRGFKGQLKIDPNTPLVFESLGRATLTDKGIEVTELPIGVWTQDYKAWLMQQQQSEDPPWGSFSERHTEKDVHFVIHASRHQINTLMKKELLSALHLRRRHSLSNMHAFDDCGRLLRLDSAADVIARFVPVRLAAYDARKAHHLAMLKRQHDRLSTQARFVSLVAEGKIELTGRRRGEIEAQLRAYSLPPRDPTAGIPESQPGDVRGHDDQNEVNDVIQGQQLGARSAPNSRPRPPEFDYLLRMPLVDLTVERVADLQSKCQGIAEDMEVLRPKTARQIYEEELVELRPILRAFLLQSEGDSTPSTSRNQMQVPP